MFPAIAQVKKKYFSTNLFKVHVIFSQQCAPAKFAFDIPSSLIKTNNNFYLTIVLSLKVIIAEKSKPFATSQKRCSQI